MSNSSSPAGQIDCSLYLSSCWDTDYPGADYSKYFIISWNLRNTASFLPFSGKKLLLVQDTDKNPTTHSQFTALHLYSEVCGMTVIFEQTFWDNLTLMKLKFSLNNRTKVILFSWLTCFMAVSPILSECFRILSKKSFRSDMDISFISSRSFGRFSIIIWQKRYWLTLGRYRFSSCSIVFKAE